MTVHSEQLVYQGPGGPFEGVAAWDDATDAARPAVLMVPNFLGQKPSDTRIVERLARLGYAGLVADVFGQGKRTTWESPDPAIYMNELNADRPLLLERLKASLAALAALPQADASRMIVIGYCFGGKAALDLARGGGDVLAAVSFHGLYDRPPFETQSPMKAKVLVCHGWDDRLSPPETLVGLGRELTEVKADWQLLAFGDAGHAFTDRAAKKGEGFGYDEAADRRSWAALRRLLRELFGDLNEHADD